MTIRVGSVGPGGLALVTAAGIVGAVLGVHGWSARHAGLVSATAGGWPATGVSSAAHSSGGHHPTTGPHGTASPARPHATASPTPSGTGPLLSSQPYASYAYQVWPGPPGAAAKQAMTGLTISVSRQGGGITVRAGVTGQSTPTAHSYPRGARVYVVETSLGDDSSGTDFNLGDDGLVVTDAQGRIVQ